MFRKIILHIYKSFFKKNWSNFSVYGCEIYMQGPAILTGGNTFFPLHLSHQLLLRWSDHLLHYHLCLSSSCGGGLGASTPPFLPIWLTHKTEILVVPTFSACFQCYWLLGSCKGSHSFPLELLLPPPLPLSTQQACHWERWQQCQERQSLDGPQLCCWSRRPGKGVCMWKKDHSTHFAPPKRRSAPYKWLLFPPPL